MDGPLVEDADAPVEVPEQDDGADEVAEWWRRRGWLKRESVDGGFFLEPLLAQEAAEEAEAEVGAGKEAGEE